jgi:hypothetical protein
MIFALWPDALRYSAAIQVVEQEMNKVQQNRCGWSPSQSKREDLYRRGKFWNVPTRVRVAGGRQRVTGYLAAHQTAEHSSFHPNGASITYIYYLLPAIKRQAECP